MIYGILGDGRERSLYPEIHDFFSKCPYTLLGENGVDENIVGNLNDKIDYGNFLKSYEDETCLGMDVEDLHSLEIGKYCDSRDTNSNKYSYTDYVMIGGRSRAYATIFPALESLLEEKDIDLTDKKIMVLGNHPVKNALSTFISDKYSKKLVLPEEKSRYRGDVEKEKPSIVICLGQNSLDNYEGDGYDHKNEDILMEKIEGVIDISIYPLKSDFYIRAKRLGKKTISSIELCLEKKRRSYELFLKKEISDSQIENYTNIINAKFTNIVLIGMPGSGKSKVGKLLAKKMGRSFIDTDDIFVEKYGNIRDFFRKYGEEEFRKKEIEIIDSLEDTYGSVISTGGGIVVKKKNYLPLKQNGKIYMIFRDLSKLPRRGRPLSLKANSMEEFYESRKDKYEYFMDLRFNNMGRIEDTVESIYSDFINDKF